MIKLNLLLASLVIMLFSNTSYATATTYTYLNSLNYTGSGGYNGYIGPTPGTIMEINFELSDGINLADHLSENLFSVDPNLVLTISDGSKTFVYGQTSVLRDSLYAKVESLDTNMDPLTWEFYSTFSIGSYGSFSPPITGYTELASYRVVSAGSIASLDRSFEAYYYPSNGNIYSGIWYTNTSPGEWEHTTPVPEPSTIFLFCTGLIAISFLRKKTVSDIV